MNLGNLTLIPREMQLQLEGELRLAQNSLPELHPGERVSVNVLAQKGQSVLIEIKGARLQVPAQAGLVPGTTLQAKVNVPGTAPGSAPVLELLSGTEAKLLPEISVKPPPSAGPATGVKPQAVLEVWPGERPPTPLPALTLGQQLPARVLGQLPSGRYLIDIYEVPLQARGPEGLMPGSTLSVAVAQLQPHVVLRILEPEVTLEAAAMRLWQANSGDRIQVAVTLPDLAQALTALGDSVSAQGVFGRVVRLDLLSALVQTLLPRTIPPDADTIATLIRDGGLHFENKLAQAVQDGFPALSDIASRDLKGLLLQVLGELDKEAPLEPEQGLSRNNAKAAAQPPFALAADDSTEILRNMVQGHLHQIENQQLTNLLARCHCEPFQLHIPLFLPQGATTAFLAIEPDGQHPPGSENRPPPGHSMLFLLKLEPLGEIRIDAHAQDQRLRVVFFGEKPEVLQAIEGELPAFRNKLLSLGFREVLLGVKHLLQVTPDRELKFAALAAGWPAAVQFLDVQA